MSEAPMVDAASSRLEEEHGARWRSIAMVVGTLLALFALINQVPSLSALWDTVRTANWWWVLLAVGFTVGNKVGYTLALIGSASQRLPLFRSIEALFAAAFSNLAVPGIGSTAVQVRYLQCQGVELAAAVAGGAVLTNVANVVVQGALFLIVLVALFTTQSIETVNLDLSEAAHVVLVVVFLSGLCVAMAYGVPRFRRRTIPPTKRGIETIRGALRSRRQVALLVVGNLMAIFMSTLCLLACVEAFGGSVAYLPILAANIVVGTVASLIPIPGGNVLVAAVGLSGALVALGVPESAGAASVITQQLITVYLPAIPGWFATNDMLRRGYL